MTTNSTSTILKSISTTNVRRLLLTFLLCFFFIKKKKSENKNETKENKPVLAIVSMLSMMYRMWRFCHVALGASCVCSRACDASLRCGQRSWWCDSLSRCACRWTYEAYQSLWYNNSLYIQRTCVWNKNLKNKRNKTKKKQKNLWQTPWIWRARNETFGAYDMCCSSATSLSSVE